MRQPQGQGVGAQGSDRQIGKGAMVSRADFRRHDGAGKADLSRKHLRIRPPSSRIAPALPQQDEVQASYKASEVHQSDKYTQPDINT